MLDHSMRKSCGGRCKSFTDEFSRSGSQDITHDACVLISCLGANTVVLEVCVLFAESIGLLVQASVSLVVEHLLCKLEGFIVDFVTTRSIPQHEEQTHERVLPQNNMTKHF